MRDPSPGTEHFQTSIQDSLEIQKKLWGKLSGLALPNLSLDIPGGGGKVGLVPSFELERKSTHSTFKGWDGYEAAYVNPEPGEIRKPLMSEVYLSEWEILNSQTYGQKNEDSFSLFCFVFNFSRRRL